MIDIPQPKPVHELKVLIIDDRTLVHEQIKNALLAQGIHQVKSAENAFYALRLCQQMAFDMVMIAFNVQSDKDGFHLLEEMKFKGHITRQTTVVFLSAETSESLVHCIVELQPDDFWVKPLNKGRIEKRLGHLLKVRQRVHKLTYCLDQKQYSAAIYYAERQLLDTFVAEYHPRINRVIGECLFELREFAEAESHYCKLSENYDHAWVHTGLTRALLKQGKADEAEQKIEKLLQRDDTRFVTYDMLAQYYIEQEQYDQAYEQIQIATKLAPRNIERNKRYWDLARLNNDRAGQLFATQNMARYAKNSIHDSPEFSLNVLRACIDLANSQSNGDSAALLAQAERKIEELTQSNPADMQLLQQLEVIKIRLLTARDAKKDADKLLKEQMPNRPSVNIEDNIDRVKALHELGHRERALALLENVKNQLEGNNFSSKVIANYVQQEAQQRHDIQFTPKQLKEMAAHNFSKRRLQPAYENLSQALTLSPSSKQIALSMLKVLAQIKQSEGLDEEQQGVIKTCINILQKGTTVLAMQQKMQEYLQQLAVNPEEDMADA